MPNLFMIPIVLTLLACGLLAEQPATPGGHDIQLLVLAIIACVGTVLFVPASSVRAPLSAASTESLAVTLSLILVLLVLPEILIQWAALLRLGVTLFLLLLAMLLVMHLFPGLAEHYRAVVATSFTILTTAPVWLGPIIEVTNNPFFLTNLVVAISPLSALAVALDFDVFRSNWFYSHSSIGSLRYEYLSWFGYIVALVILCGTILIAAGNRSYKRKQQS